MKLPSLSVLVVAALFSCGAATAQEYPSRPVRLVVPTSPGTGTDVTARYLADKLGAELKGAFVVENKVGANGMIAAEYVAKQPADGYTLLVSASLHYINKSLQPTLPYDPVKDFRPIARVSVLYLALVTPSSSPYKSVADLVADMKARPGEVNYASAGSGSTTHLAPALLNSMTATRATHVPYKGGAQALVDTISGVVPFTFTAIASAMPHLKSGRLHALAVTGSRRAKSLPDVPTIAEGGLAGYEIASTTGIVGPAGLTDAVVRTLSAALQKIANTQAFADFVIAQGFEVDVAGPEAYAADIGKEVAHWAKVVAVSGAKAN
jgi:tripartite-type tricarboxylate transporter receptor subunit TctC